MIRESNIKLKKPQLSASRVAAAALALADAKGLDALSFRSVGKTLSCEAMSLYHYFPSKAHLLDAMVDICISELKWPDASLPWPKRLKLLGMEYRAMALRHPGFFPFIAVYRMNSRSGLTILNGILEVFAASGLEVERRARHFRVFGYYLVGACLDETIGYVKGPSSADPVPMEDAQVLFPAIMAVGRFFGSEHHARTFELGLNILIDEMEQEVNSILR